jgi:hypothetical protein
MRRSLPLLAILAFVLSSCGGGDPTSVKPVAANPAYSEEVAAAVSYVTQGQIAPDTGIEIRLSEELGAPESVIPVEAIRFEPAIRGEARWKDARTVLFAPSEPLPLRASYKGSVDLRALSPSLPAERIPLSIYTPPRAVSRFDSGFEGVAGTDGAELRYEASFSFNVDPSESALKTAARVTLDGSPVGFSLAKASDGSWRLSSEPLARGAERRKVSLALDRAALSLDAPFARDAALEAAGGFSLLGAWPEFEGDKASIVLSLSAPLAEGTRLSDFIKVEPAASFEPIAESSRIRLRGSFAAGTSYRIGVAEGLKDRYGATLAASQASVAVEDMKPQAQFAQGGSWLTSASDGRIYVKTVNVSALRVTVRKVFESNLGQFLQTESLDSGARRREGFNDEYMNRVGVTVASQELDIGMEKNRWLSSELDLRGLIKKGDKGLFVIDISFGREDFLWNPPESEEEEDDEDYYWDYSSSDPRSWYYLESYGRASKALVMSDLGLSAKEDAEAWAITATSLISAKPVSGASVRLFSYQNQLLAEAATAASGMAIIKKAGLAAAPYYIVAEKGTDRSFVRISDMSWNLSNFDAGGVAASASGLKSYLFTDRGVYRPGEEVRLSAILRDDQGNYPSGQPAELKLTDPRGRVAREEKRVDARDGVFVFAFSTKDDDPTGTWTAQVRSGASSFSLPIKIETVVANRLKIDILPAKEALGFRDASLDVSIKSDFLFGAPASNLAAQLKLELRNAPKSYASWQGYTFESPLRVFSPRTEQLFSGRLDKDGKASARWRLPEAATSFPGGAVANLIASVSEDGGRAVYQSIAVPYDPFPAYVGLKAPDIGYSVKPDSELEFKVVAVDPAGKALAGRQLKWTLYRRESYWWWEYDSYDEWRRRFKSDRLTTVESSGALASRAEAQALKLAPAKNGSYLLEVEDGSGHASGFSFYASTWGVDEPGEDPGIIKIKPDKPSYAPGQSATVSFPAPERGTVFWNVEKGGKVLSRSSYELSAKTRSKEGISAVSVPLTKDHVPNVYVSVSIVQPLADLGNDMPLRMYGICPLMVSDPSTVIDLELQTAAEFRPNEEFEVKLKTKDGKPAQIILAVVDEGLLSLTNHRSPDPWSRFFAKEMLGVRTADMYGQVLGAFREDLWKRFAIGGGGDEDFMAEATPSMAKRAAEGASPEEAIPEKERRFEPVAFFKGPFMTDAAGRASASFSMPNYMGQVRVMAVAVDGKRYGSIDRKVQVTSPLVLLTTLPRVIGPGEAFELPASLFATKDGFKAARLAIATQGPVSVTGPRSIDVNFDSSRQAQARFQLKTTLGVGQTVITVTATSGSESSTSRTAVEVRSSSPPVERSEAKSIRQGETIAFDVPGDAIAGTVKASIGVSLLGDFSLGKRMRWLIQYPYGCVEQTVSAAFPQLYLKPFLKMGAGDEARVDENVGAAIERLGKYLTPSGGLAYWPGGSVASAWGTSYAFHFLIEAKARGYSVPSSLLSSVQAYQAERASSTADSSGDKAYRLYGLALAGQKPISGFNLLRENEWRYMDDSSKLMVAASYAILGRTDEAKAIAEGIAWAERADYELSGSFGSPLRDRAVFLEMALRLKLDKKADALFASIGAEVGGSAWHSTQALSWALRAMGLYAESVKTGAPYALRGALLVDGKRATTFDADGAFAQVDVSAYAGKRVELSLERLSGSVRAQATLDWKGVPRVSEGMDVRKRLELIVRYFDEDGRAVYPVNGSVRQGASVWALYTVRRDSGGSWWDPYWNDKGLDNLALSAIQPSGFEIENPRLTGESYPAFITRAVDDWSRRYGYAILGQGDYVDYRDDRVTWFFGMRWGYARHFAVKLRAVTAGDFSLPPATCEAMYSSDFYAEVKGGRLAISGN